MPGVTPLLFNVAVISDNPLPEVGVGVILPESDTFQLNEVPLMLLPKLVVVVGFPAQIIWLLTASIVGFGFTTIFAVTPLPTHPAAAGVIV